MANVIDTLIVELKLKTDGYNKASKDAEKQLDKFTDQNKLADKTATAFSKNATDGFKSIRNGLLGMGAAILSIKGVKDFFESTITGQAQLGRNAGLLNANARELDAWGKVMGNVGGKAEDFLGVTQNLQKNMRDLKYGRGGFEMGAFFQSAEIPYEVNGKVRDLRELYGDIADFMQKAPHEKRMNAAEALGLNDSMIALLSKGRAEVQKLYDAQYKASGVTDESIKTAQEAEAAWNDLGNTFKSVGQTIFNSLAPAMKDVNQQLLKFSEWINNNKDSGIKDAFKVIAGLTNMIADGWKNIWSWIDRGLQLLAEFQVKNESKDKNKKAGESWISRTFNDVKEKYFNSSQKASQPLQSQIYSNKDLQNVISKSEQSSSNDPRGIRNNNPGNIRAGDFATRHGAIGKDKDGFAIFPDMKSGANAQASLLDSYANKGINTIRGIVSKYAPKTENDTEAYIKAMTKETGAGADDVLTATQRMKLQRGMWKHELGGEAMAKRVETSIGNINVYTQATDANQIAKDLPGAIKSNPLVIANTQGMH